MDEHGVLHVLPLRDLWRRARRESRSMMVWVAGVVGRRRVCQGRTCHSMSVGRRAASQSVYQVH